MPGNILAVLFKSIVNTLDNIAREEAERRRLKEEEK